MPKEVYHTKVSNWLTDVMLEAKRKLREKVPTQEQFDMETQNIAHPNEGEMRATRTRGEVYLDPTTGKLREQPARPGDIISDLMNVADAGVLVGGAGRFGKIGKEAKALLKEWHGLGLKDLTLDNAMQYLKTPAKDLMVGNVDHPIAARIAEAGGNPLRHIPEKEIEDVLRQTGYADFSPGVKEGLGESAHKQLNPGLESQIPKIDVPRTPQEFDAFHNSIPDPRAGLDQIPPNNAVPGQDFNPAMMTEQRAYDAPRSQTRPGRGRRVEDRELAQVQQMVEQGQVQGMGPDQIATQMERMGIDPANYADLLGGPGNAGGMAPGLGTVSPENMVSGVRQQPTPTDDFAGAVNKLLQSTNDWDETVKQIVTHTKAQKLSKEEVTNKLMDEFGHENPQLSTLVNKYWK